jgi:hypothetical protein
MKPLIHLNLKIRFFIFRTFANETTRPAAVLLAAAQPCQPSTSGHHLLDPATPPPQRRGCHRHDPRGGGPVYFKLVLPILFVFEFGVEFDLEAAGAVRQHGQHGSPVLAVQHHRGGGGPEEDSHCQKGKVLHIKKFQNRNNYNYKIEATIGML